MFTQIFNVLQQIIEDLVNGTINLFVPLFDNATNLETLGETIVNFSLFSETPIFTMTMLDIIFLTLAIFYSLFFIVLIYKVTKKIIKKVFGVFRL